MKSKVNKKMSVNAVYLTLGRKRDSLKTKEKNPRTIAVINFCCMYLYNKNPQIVRIARTWMEVLHKWNDLEIHPISFLHHLESGKTTLE